MRREPVEQLNVRLTRDLKNRLQDTAKRERRSMTVIVELALEHYLHRSERRGDEFAKSELKRIERR